MQSGKLKVLDDMKRRYTREEFEQVCDYLLKHVPDITITTDIICGFQGETEAEWRETMSLIEKYKFPEVHISQFYAAKYAGISNETSKYVDRKNGLRRLTRINRIVFAVDKIRGTKNEGVDYRHCRRYGISLVGHTKVTRKFCYQEETKTWKNIWARART